MNTGLSPDVLLDLDEEMLATLAEVAGEQWSRLEHLMALLVDSVNVVAYHTGLAVAKNPNQLRPPKPLERPGVEKRRGTTLDEFTRMMGGD